PQQTCLRIDRKRSWINIGISGDAAPNTVRHDDHGVGQRCPTGALPRNRGWSAFVIASVRA
ncbi:MAG: hypothetical protein ACRDJH_17495, partial [Thermomicrobiales bacterium]